MTFSYTFWILNKGKTNRLPFRLRLRHIGIKCRRFKIIFLIFLGWLVTVCHFCLLFQWLVQTRFHPLDVPNIWRHVLKHAPTDTCASKRRIQVLSNFFFWGGGEVLRPLPKPPQNLLPCCQVMNKNKYCYSNLSLTLTSFLTLTRKSIRPAILLTRRKTLPLDFVNLFTITYFMTMLIFLILTIISQVFRNTVAEIYVFFDN